MRKKITLVLSAIFFLSVLCFNLGGAAFAAYNPVLKSAAAQEYRLSADKSVRGFFKDDISSITSTGSGLNRAVYIGDSESVKLFYGGSVKESGVTGKADNMFVVGKHLVILCTENNVNQLKYYEISPADAKLSGNGTVLSIPVEPGESITCVAYHPESSTLFVGKNKMIVTYIITEDPQGGLIASSTGRSRTFTNAFSDIYAYDGSTVIYVRNGRIYSSDIETGTEETNLKPDTRFFGEACAVSGNKLYYTNYTGGFRISYYADFVSGPSRMLSNKTDKIKSDEITSADYIFADEECVFIADNTAQKVVCLDPVNLAVSYAISSYSYDSGRFNSPVNVSVFKKSVAVSDRNNDRVQILKDRVFESQVDIEKPDNAVIDGEGFVYAISGGKLYKSERVENGYSAPALLSSFTNVVDIKLNRNGEVFILTESGVFTVDGEHRITVAAPKQFCVDNKTGRIYVTTDRNIIVYSSDYHEVFVLQDDERLSLPSGAIKGISADFSGSLYLLMQSGNSVTVNKIIAPAYSQMEIYEIGGVVYENKSVSGFAIDSEDGTAYFAATGGNALFTVSQSSLGIAIPTDIPRISLNSNPLASPADYTVDTAVVAGYPSSWLFPFYPAAAVKPSDEEGTSYAFEDGLRRDIQTGTRILTFKDETADYYIKGYSLVYYEGKFGYVLRDNLSFEQPQSAPYEKGALKSGAVIYNAPLADKLFETAAYKGGNVTVISCVADTEYPEIGWFKIEYSDGGAVRTGFVIDMFVEEADDSGSSDNKPPEEGVSGAPGKIKDGIGNVSIYQNPDKKSKEVGVLNPETEFEILEYTEDGKFAKVVFKDENGKRNTGYAEAKYLQDGNAIDSIKTGFILIGTSVGLSIIFYCVKRRWFS